MSNEDESIVDANPDALEAALGDDYIEDDEDDLFVKRKSGEDEDEDGVIFAFNDEVDNPFDLI